MRKLMFIPFVLILFGCGENPSSSENELLCAESEYIEEGFHVLSGKFKGETIDYPNNLVRFNPPELSEIYIINFNKDFSVVNRRKAVFNESGDIINNCD